MPERQCTVISLQHKEQTWAAMFLFIFIFDDIQHSRLLKHLNYSEPNWWPVHFRRLKKAAVIGVTK